MRPKNSDNRRRNRKNQSPTRTRPVNSIEPGQTRSSRLSPSAASASLLDNELITDELSLFESLQISPDSPGPNPRSFPYAVKQQCWEKAEKIKGRDPDRWRKDALGNTLFKKLVGCPGCLCHDYDHIIPYSKGGKSTLENCQVLQVLAFQIQIDSHANLHKQQLIDLKGTTLRYQSPSLSKEVHTVGFQGVTWIFLNSPRTVMFDVDKTLEDATSNDNFVDCLFSRFFSDCKFWLKESGDPPNFGS